MLTIEAAQSDQQKSDLAGYQAVVLGSAIRIGSWLSEMTNYIKANRPALYQLPATLFTVHLLNAADDAAGRAARQAYTAALRQRLSVKGEAYFAGKMDYSTLAFFDRLIAQAVEKRTKTPIVVLTLFAALAVWAADARVGAGGGA